MRRALEALEDRSLLLWNVRSTRPPPIPPPPGPGKVGGIPRPAGIQVRPQNTNRTEGAFLATISAPHTRKFGHMAATLFPKNVFIS